LCAPAGSTPFSLLRQSEFVSIYDIRETLKVKIFSAKNVNISDNYKVLYDHCDDWLFVLVQCVFKLGKGEIFVPTFEGVGTFSLYYICLLVHFKNNMPNFGAVSSTTTE